MVWLSLGCITLTGYYVIEVLTVWWNYIDRISYKTENFHESTIYEPNVYISSEQKITLAKNEYRQLNVSRIKMIIRGHCSEVKASQKVLIFQMFWSDWITLYTIQIH